MAAATQPHTGGKDEGAGSSRGRLLCCCLLAADGDVAAAGKGLRAACYLLVCWGQPVPRQRSPPVLLCSCYAMMLWHPLPRLSSPDARPRLWAPPAAHQPAFTADHASPCRPRPCPQPRRYFCVDPDTAPGRLVVNRTVTLKETVAAKTVAAAKQGGGGKAK